MRTPADALASSFTLRAYEALFARAIALTAEPALGLHCGLFASEPSFDLVGPLVSHAHTLRHAIGVGRRFQPLLIDDVRLLLTERAGSAQLRVDFPRLHSGFDRSFAEFALAGLLRLLRLYGGAREHLFAVQFEHVRPDYHHEYIKAFGPVVRCGQPFTGLEFERRLLDRPHLHRRPELHALLCAGAEHYLERLTRPQTFAERVQALLRTQPSMRTIDMRVAAHTLGISVRSLRRRLAEEGSSYRAVTQAALQDSARAMLRDPQCTLQAAAHALGFADASAFHRAFRRWTGLTPIQYREQS
jgi:AraC-like DNA-binding protein